ncbi:hypothetical protein ALT721_2150032 [Alteromonas alvinellae]
MRLKAGRCEKTYVELNQAKRKVSGLSPYQAKGHETVLNISSRLLS